MIALKYAVKFLPGEQKHSTSDSERDQYTGIRQLLKVFEWFGVSASDSASLALQEYVNDFLLERVRVNTPINTGALRRSLKADLGYQKNKLRAKSLTIKATVPYAFKVHEEEYQLGPRSAAQPDTPEGGVGNKFIERVVHYHASDMLDEVGARFMELLVRKLYPSGRMRTARRKTRI